MAKKKRSFAMKMPQKYDLPLHICILLLLVFGTLMIVSTSVGKAETNQLSVVSVFVKQSAFVVLSYISMVQMANRFSFEKFHVSAIPIGIALIGLCFCTLFFAGVNGAKAWIRLGPVTIQPTEFVKIFMICLIGLQVYVVGKRVCEWNVLFKIPFLFFGVFFIIAILQKDIGTLAVISFICLVTSLVPSNKGLRKFQKHIRICTLVGVLCVLFFMSAPGIKLLNEYLPSSLGHIAERFSNAANPFTDPYDRGYQLIQGLVGMASGGLQGKGWGQSQQKFGFLTQADNDFILAIVIEELGIFGLSFIVVLYGVVLYRLYYYAILAKNEGYKIILVGVATYIFFHFFLNVGGAGGLIPLTGVPLLFISSGGSSLIAVMLGIGISQSVISKIRKA